MNFDRSLRALCVCALAALALVSGCGGGGENAAEPPPASPAPAPTSQTVGAAGGTVASAEGAELRVPAGALRAEVAIVVAAAPGAAPPLPPGLLALGKVFAITPHGTGFAMPAMVSVPFDPARVPAGVAPVLYKADGAGAAAAEWRAVPGATVQGAAMSAPVTSLSYFVVAPPLEFVGIDRLWRFHALRRFPPALPIGSGHDDTTSAPVVASYDVGPGLLSPARAHVFSSPTGITYGIGVDSPRAVHHSDPIGAEGDYEQVQWFRKRDAAAVLRFTITRAEVLALDDNSRPKECNPEGGGCKELLGHLHVEVSVWNMTRTEGIYFAQSAITLGGTSHGWYPSVSDSFLDAAPLWRERDIEDVTENRGQYQLRLVRPLPIEVPIDSVPIGDEIALQVRIHVVANNRRQGESLVKVYFRDPQDPFSGGIELEYKGLDHADPHRAALPPIAQQPAPLCTGAPDPAAGTLQFESPTFMLDESAGLGALVHVTRSGGNRGRVTARFATAGGSAVPGTHYTAQSRVLGFGDGEDGRRAVFIPLIDDGEPNANRTLELMLDDVRGCAALGANARALLTIADDDYVIVAPGTYRVGGSINGLLGSGLVLEDSITSDSVAPLGDGSFTFAYPYHEGFGYNVRVRTQPNNPPQSCSVANGRGIVGAADVVNVTVICVNLAANGALDPSFGSAGKVTSVTLDAAAAAAVHADGRIVVLGRNYLARFLRDGEVDAGFGSGGVAPLDLQSGIEEMRDVAVQPDDKIVVAGKLRFADVSAMGVMRFNADGTPDAGFGSGGRATIHPFANANPFYAWAYKVHLMADGRILLAGWAAMRSSTGNSFAVARLNADGSPDTSFGGDGAATHSRGGTEIAYAMALQSDGKIVLAGRTGSPADYDAGLARFHPDGSADVGGPLHPNGDVDPDVYYGVDGSGFSFAPLDAASNKVYDLLMLPDGTTAGLVHSKFGGAVPFALARFDTVGRRAGLTLTPIGSGDSLPRSMAKQADGKIVMVGSTSGSTVTDFAVVRYNADLSIDTGFGNNGIVSVDFFAALDTAFDVVIQPGGGIIVVGAGRNGTRNRLAMVRIAP
jgi:uncharacterized delta-60 repeat protein